MGDGGDTLSDNASTGLQTEQPDDDEFMKMQNRMKIPAPNTGKRKSSTSFRI